MAWVMTAALAWAMVLVDAPALMCDGAWARSDPPSTTAKPSTTASTNVAASKANMAASSTLKAKVEAAATNVVSSTAKASTADASDVAALDLASLNIRLSRRAIHPPARMVRDVVALPAAIRAARATIAPSPQSAILEDDHHRRALVLSTLDDGRLRVYVLEPLDLAATMPMITACAEARGCAYDRRPVTGGLGCVALCIRQALDPNRHP